MKDYLARISARIPQFQTMNESELNYIKVGSYALPLFSRFCFSTYEVENYINTQDR